ncbi:amidophosphoribosyltransferase [Arthrobacter crystallopoietes BAB-32]|uniref:Amidophosphoribosyltransferase n=1 Tax=Arthrobacter crystallopoietes BAB-32 TaxID=1246476 RepID=N1UYY5_9MICC|nr:phosphoribosyltransferase family protein [Arthrobacter crystallopoietes]EMY33042.1 amidophosphoribosyltransferase [Arthrobacter crystallopoietes BAB-32]
MRPYRAEAGAESLPLTGSGLDDVLPVVAAGRYRRELSQAVLAFKNHGRTDLAPVLAPAFAGAVQEAVALANGGRVFLVPVPSRTSSRRRRGYDPMDMLLRRLQRAGLLPPDVQIRRVVQVRTPLRSLIQGVLPGTSQKSLGRSGRRRNVAFSMRLKSSAASSVAGVHCIVVDDVLTTGATLAELTRVLVAAGAQVDAGAVLAATTAPSGTEAHQAASALSVIQLQSRKDHRWLAGGASPKAKFRQRGGE